MSVNGEQAEDQARISVCFGSIKPSTTGRVVYNDRVNRGDADECDRIALMCTSDRDYAINECKATASEFDVYPQIEMVTSNCTGVVNTGVKLSNLKYLDVMANGERCVSLVDSGAEIEVLSEGLDHKLQVDTCGHINMRSIFSDLCWPTVYASIRTTATRTAVLKESWTGQRAVCADIGRPVEVCMDGLRRRLKDAADRVELHARHGQEVHVHSYILRSKDKHVNQGDTVVVLNDETTGEIL